ncbi:hypothetical protein GGR54DRAFT_486146 [Hypoxylon sp. NC1633]|nr:hypothetical protein GGR54DRAFT_486146 [Hypoxylon sp. NC1633]
MSMKKKISVIGLFMMGGIVTLASILRVVVLTYYINTLFISGPIAALLDEATGVEVYVAIIGSCAPIIVPLYKRIRDWGGWARCARASSPLDHAEATRRRKPSCVTSTICQMSTRRSPTGESNCDRSFERLDTELVMTAPYHGSTFHQTNISSQSRWSSSQTDDLPLQGIRVKYDVHCD